MDKNTIIGFVLIAAILIGFSWLNKPSEEELAKRKHYNDSITLVNQANEAAALLQQEMQQNDTATKEAVVPTLSLKTSMGTEEFVTIENDLLKLVFSTKGGFVYSAELKQFRTHDSLPLILFNGPDENLINFAFLTVNNRILNSSELYFKPFVTRTDSNSTVTMRLAVDSVSYIDFVYDLPKDNYMVDFKIVPHNMTEVLDARMQSVELTWTEKIRQQEKSRKFENRYATLNFKYTGDDMEALSESKNDRKQGAGRINWIAFKDQFFSSILIADKSFRSGTFESNMAKDNSKYLKFYSTRTAVDLDPSGQQPTNLKLYYGPNQYKILDSYNKNMPEGVDKWELEELIPLGWSLFRWISKWLIIPLFNFFGSFISNYGIIILLLTIVVKLILLPFTFKSYMSSAKMRVLKPQIDEINAKIPPEKAMERQQATMNLYQKVGVSPMSGCLPLLLQMPILFAMFSFFPASIELRQQSFLWAQDLSSYDPIISWDAYIPIITPYFGNHISLFCLLMTITNIIYTKINMASQGGGGEQMKMMKWMMYLMPLMFLFMFNDYASGLSYYYFISLLITIGQTYLFRLSVNEEKLLKQLEANKKKPKKKSGFMARLEEAQRLQQQQMKQQNKKK
ncbi:MAG: membrane protein insertase YidC [Sphingobacteriia bacterium]|nr:membrane protein insertase YidC [Sphingobacteriia bacterium]